MAVDGIAFKDTFSVVVSLLKYNAGEDENVAVFRGFYIGMYDADDKQFSNEDCYAIVNSVVPKGHDSRFCDFFNFEYSAVSKIRVSHLLATEAALQFFENSLKKGGFAINKIYNVILSDSHMNDLHYVHDGLKSVEDCKKMLLYVRDSYLEAKGVDWLKRLEDDPTEMTKCPTEVLQKIKPKMANVKKMGILDENNKVLKFKQFNDSRVWEPLRKKVIDYNMPNVGKQSDYLMTVKEEIANILKNLFKFDQNIVDDIQNKIWLELKNEWQEILDDSLVNWDTPSVCAQKCLTKMKEFIPSIQV